MFYYEYVRPKKNEKYYSCWHMNFFSTQSYAFFQIPVISGTLAFVYQVLPPTGTTKQVLTFDSKTRLVVFLIVNALSLPDDAESIENLITVHRIVRNGGGGKSIVVLHVLYATSRSNETACPEPPVQILTLAAYEDKLTERLGKK